MSATVFVYLLRYRTEVTGIFTSVFKGNKLERRNKTNYRKKGFSKIFGSLMEGYGSGTQENLWIRNTGYFQEVKHQLHTKYGTLSE
jgi:hypothetical protein